MTCWDVELHIQLWSRGKPDLTDPAFAPILHKKLQGLPLCFAFAAEVYPLCDDALVFDDKLSV